MARRFLTGFLLALVAMAAGPLAVGAAVTAAAPPTVVQHVRPVGPGGNLLPGYKSVHSRTGAHCNAGSDPIHGAAYRCFAGNGVYDPCWVSSNRSFVYCLAEPWSFEVVQLHVTKGYSNAGFSSHVSKTPWGLQLGNGTLCSQPQGAGGRVGGHDITYYCQHVKYVLVGQIDKHHKAWRIRKARSTGGGHYKLDGWVNLTKAWLGKPSRKG